ALLAHADRMTAEGFLKPQNRALILVADNVEELLNKMQNA
ncbi:MAG: TIGR00730 family Rossman fold protein, partial [Runella slithyformis]